MQYRIRIVVSMLCEVYLVDCRSHETRIYDAIGFCSDYYLCRYIASLLLWFWTLTSHWSAQWHLVDYSIEVHLQDSVYFYRKASVNACVYVFWAWRCWKWEFCRFLAFSCAYNGHVAQIWMSVCVCGESKLKSSNCQSTFADFLLLDQSEFKMAR